MDGLFDGLDGGPVACGVAGGVADQAFAVEDPGGDRERLDCHSARFRPRTNLALVGAGSRQGFSKLLVVFGRNVAGGRSALSFQALVFEPAAVVAGRDQSRKPPAHQPACNAFEAICRTILTTFVTLLTQLSWWFLYSFEDLWAYGERHHPYACWGAKMLVGGRRSAPQVPRGNASVSTFADHHTFITS